MFGGKSVKHVQLLIILLINVSFNEGRTFSRDMSVRVVNTRYGRLRGMVVEPPNKSLTPVEVFLGLQYASVLGGELRFMPPTNPMEKWDGIRVAITTRPVCPQKIPTEEDMLKYMPKARVDHLKRIIPYLKDQSEECLNLNVYVPVRGK